MPDPLHDRLEHATAFIDCGALCSNLVLAKNLAGSAAQLCMVKANAYGNGMVEVAEALQGKCQYLGVARMFEAILLRERGIACPLVLFSHHFRHEDFAIAAENNITPGLYAEANLAAQLAACRDHDLGYWLKIDTGMHRLGLSLDAPLLGEALSSNLCEVAMTHLHSADEIPGDSVAQQLRRFDALLQQAGYDAGQRKISVANSALLLRDRRVDYADWMASRIRGYCADLDIARPGIMLYGADPLQQSSVASRALLPVMRFAAPVIDLRQVPTGAGVGYGANWKATRQSWIATVAAGYGDGYPRHAPNGTPLMVNNRAAALAGRVSMDSIGVDVTDIIKTGQDVAPGDTAVLWGEAPRIEEVAGLAGTISYQLMTGVSARVERIYL